jgi:protein-disulfide isomerase
MIEVIVIGTDPPCLRCNMLVQRVYEVADEHRILVQVRRLPFHSLEAQALAEGWEREFATARDVARRGSVDVDWGRVTALMKQPWSPALDDELRPCQELADKVRILMTPVLIVNGRLRHHGSVPDREPILAWLKEETSGPQTG